MTDFTARPENGCAWVTGASSGIGRAVALKLSHAGFSVAATARDEEKLGSLVAEGAGRIHAFAGDVTNAEDMTKMVEAISVRLGPPALAVLNAGVFIPVHGERLSQEDFDKTFAVNLNGTVYCLVPAVAAMKQAGRGQIAIVSSVTGYGGLPTSAAYGATKAALINMAESLRFDLDKLGIRMQVINPGFVDTPATKQNEFPMPALVTPEVAAQEIVEGLGRGGFEITFPRRFTYGLKVAQLLPYGLYFALINRVTGWKKRPLKQADDV
ncbi:oxidoreductase [Xaviernesmea oryzae]|uniref:Oxidoreductase n=1 Tax=Xaviernesmea oryzae TaxID=464029 RepID=A0A1Q9AWT3_9HYPH|nr:SDR family NAD(P)-dependent oxidoreductase [Xaviernesmea oryzae]OLP59888.1 oxidoreductase [Xaviernesmea oryzae]SEK47098.1 Short-chain dehydrogenase [Xaviernesmea oryzae]